MVKFAQVVSLDYQVDKDSAFDDLFILTESKVGSIDQLVEEGSSSEFEIEVKLTDGDSSFYSTLSRKDIEGAKHKKNNQEITEWTTLFIQSLFNELPLQLIESIELSGREFKEDGKNKLDLELKSKIGPSIYQTLGTIRFELVEDEEIDYANQLFEWARLMSHSNREQRKDKLKEQEEKKTYIEEANTSKKFATKIVEQSKAKELYTLRVMTKLLNEKKSHYEKLLKGEIQEDSDDFNILAIKSIKDDLIKEDEEKGKPGKRYKKNPKTSKPLKKLNIKARWEKGNQERAHVNDGKEDEFVPDAEEAGVTDDDNQVQRADPEADHIKLEVKKEDSPGLPPVKRAKSEKSIRFQFQNEKDQEGESDKMDIDIKESERSTDKSDDKKSDADEDTEVDDDTEEEEEEEEEKDREADIGADEDATEEDNGTVTDTDTESDS